MPPLVQVELAVPDSGREGFPLSRGEDQRRAVRVPGVTDRDDVLAAFLGARRQRNLDAGLVGVVARAAPAPDNSGQVRFDLGHPALLRHVLVRLTIPGRYRPIYETA